MKIHGVGLFICLSGRIGFDRVLIRFDDHARGAGTHLG